MDSRIFFCFILPDGTSFPCFQRNGHIDFPWGDAMRFIQTARSVFSAHQASNALGCLACDEITKNFEDGKRSLDFMYEVACFVLQLRKRWNMDK